MKTKISQRLIGYAFTSLAAVVLATATSAAQLTPEQLAAIQARAEEGRKFLEDQLAKAQAEAEARLALRPPLNPIAAQRIAEAAQQAKLRWIQQEIVPWLQTDERAEDGAVIDAAVAEKRRRDKLQSLARELRRRADVQKKGVDDFLRANPGWSRTWRDADGTLHLIDRIERGIPRAKVGFNLGSADTVSADEVWPGGSTSFALTGTNVFIGLWDQGQVRTNHQEFSTNGLRVTNIDAGNTNGLDNHSTHVAGTLAAWGVSTNAKGFSHRSIVWL